MVDKIIPNIRKVKFNTLNFGYASSISRGLVAIVNPLKDIVEKNPNQYIKKKFHKTKTIEPFAKNKRNPKQTALIAPKNNPFFNKTPRKIGDWKYNS